MNKDNFFDSISTLKGVGPQLSKYLKKRKRIKPTGFTIGGNNLYLTNSDGNLIVISLSAGNILKIEKVGRDLISKPLIYNENLFIVKNGSITQYD